MIWLIQNAILECDVRANEKSSHDGGQGGKASVSESHTTSFAVLFAASWAARLSQGITWSRLTCRVRASLIINWLQVVYVARNPKDVIVSYYFHHKLIKVHGYTGTLDEFAEFFINDEGKSNNIPPSTFRITDECLLNLNNSCVRSFFSTHFGRLV